MLRIGQHLDLPLERKREVIRMLSEEHPAKVACEVLGVTRSSYYCRPIESPGEAETKEATKEETTAWPTYGCRRIIEQLQRGEWVTNHKRVQRLMRLMDIQTRIRRKKRRTTNNEHDYPRYLNLVLGLEIVRPEQVWVCEIV